MNIWVINAAEPLPIDDAKGRLLRCGILCDKLVRMGHKVTWWTSTFHHARKFQRFEKTTVRQPSEKLKLICMKGRRYQKHVSVGRMLNHLETGLRFFFLADKEPKPDVILCSFPLIELALAATHLGRKWNVPVILDIRDLWPDIFEEQFTGWKKIFAGPIIFPFAWATRVSCRRADGITGITQGLMEWGVKKIGREVRESDKAFPHGYKLPEISIENRQKGEGFWRKQGVERHHFIVPYFGAINCRHEFELVVEAGKMLQDEFKELRILICGSGDHLEKVRDLAKDVPNIIVPGWIAQLEMGVLAEMSKLGLAPYKSDFNYLESVPTKAIEYFSYGLPVVSSLQGRLQELLEEKQCGVTYQNGSAKSLADALRNLITNSQRVEEMKKRSLRLFAERYDAEKVYGDMAHYLESFVKPSRNA